MVPEDTGSFVCRQGKLGVLFLHKSTCLGKSISMLGPGDRGEETRGLSRRRAVGRARLSIGYIGLRGGNARKPGRWHEAAATRTAALRAFKTLPQTGASSRKLASALLE